MKGQITIFIIIGILVLAAFSITFYAATRINQPEQQIEQLNVQTVTDYITSCLEISSIEGLTLLGKQGGHLYKSQHGITPDLNGTDVGVSHITYSDLDFGSVNIPYLVQPPEGQVGELFFSTTPTYPYPRFPYPEPGEPLFQGYYGLGALPPLYKVSPDNESVPGSIQASLESYIAHRVVACSDFAQYKAQGYEFSAGEPIVTVLLPEKEEQFVGEHYVNIQLEWPVDVTTPQGKSLISTFATRVPARLVTLYYRVKNFIDAEVSDISHVPSSSGSFELETLNNIWGDDSLVIVRDKESIIQTQPYEFWVARKNRPAALWQIDEIGEVSVALDGDGTPAQIERVNDTNAILRIASPCEETQLIPLQATDPDENPITFRADPGKITLGMEMLTIFAEDGSRQTDRYWHDYEEIPLQVRPCEID